MTPVQKELNFFLEPIVPVLANVQWPFLPAMLLGGVLAAVVGFLIGWPALRLRGDYLAIATLGFGEIIRVLFVNMQRVTNGSLGLKGIPEYTNVYWSWGLALVTIFVTKRLVDSSYGRALKAIRDDEVAAEALELSGIAADDVEWVIFHQANKRIMDAAAKRLGIPMERVAMTIEKLGNTSAASMPITLDYLYRDGKLNPGDHILWVGFGAGFSLGAAVTVWTKQPPAK